MAYRMAAVKRKVSNKKKDRERIGRFGIYAAPFLAVLLIILSGIMYSEGQISTHILDANATIGLSLVFPLAVFAYLTARGNSPGKIIDGLRLQKNRATRAALAAGMLLFLFIFAIEIFGGVVQSVTGISLPTNASLVVDGMPLYFLVFTVLIAPINEEIFFRGFLVPRIGILFSAAIFAAMHVGYGSIMEIAGAFIFGIAAGYVLKRTDSLYPSIIAHMLVNLLTVVLIASVL